MGLVNFSYKNWWYQIWYAKVNSVRCHNFVIRKKTSTNQWNASVIMSL